MAYFAKIGLNSKVLSTQVVDNIHTLNADKIEDESVGQQFLENIHGWPKEMWIKCSYNTRENKYYNPDNSLSNNQNKKFRGNFPSLGYIWDEENNLFFPPKPFSSWTKDLINAIWESPIPYPTKTVSDNFILPTSYIDKISSNNLYWDENLYQSNSNKGWKFYNYLNYYTWNKDTLNWILDT